MPSLGTTFEPLYSSATAITVTSVASLTSGSAAGSAVVDNSTNLYEDALVGVTIVTGASGTSSAGVVTVYAYSDVDGTPHYTDSVSGADATQTLTSPTNLRVLGVINCVANATTYYGGRFSVARAFGGWLPKKWGIVLQNGAGATLGSSGSSANFIGVNGQIP